MEKVEEMPEELLISRSLSYLQQKVLPDKGVADCVEAILGAYVLVSSPYLIFVLIGMFVCMRSQ